MIIFRFWKLCREVRVVKEESKNMKQSWVYTLKCSNGTYNTRVTSNLTLRIKRHETSFYENSYISIRLPVELVYYCEFIEINIAIKKEKQIKKWSNSKKEALINGEYDQYPI